MSRLATSEVVIGANQSKRQLIEQSLDTLATACSLAAAVWHIRLIFTRNTVF